MARKAGVITIDLNAGTAKFLVDMDKANAKLRDFGKAGVNESKAVGTAMKALEGGVLKNGRAAEWFFETVVKGGAVARVAFPVLGAVAFAGAIAETTNRVREFFKELKEGPEKVTGALRAMLGPVRQANNDLAVANARLEQDIAKLEGRRENTVKTMLLEAAAAADKLAESLERDLASLHRVLKEQNVGFWKRLFGKEGTSDITEEIGGESGRGGFLGRIEEVTDAGTAQVRAATTPAAKDAAQAALNTRLAAEYRQELEKIAGLLQQTESLQRLHQGRGTPADRKAYFAAHPGMNPAWGAENSVKDQTTRLAMLRGVMRQLNLEMDSIALRSENAALGARKNELQGNANAAALTRPFEERIRAMETTLEGARAALESAGLGPTAKALTAAYAESLQAIAAVDQELGKHHQALSEGQKAEIQSLAGKTALTQVEAQWKDRLHQTTAQILEQTRSQEQLTAAIGQGAAAERQARIDTRLMSAIGAENYGNPGWMAAHAGDVAQLRAGITAEVEAQRRQQGAAAVYTLQQELGLQARLAEAQREGEAAIRRITAAEILRSGIERGLTGQQIAAEIQLYYAKLRTQSAATVAKLEAETTATEKLTSAQLAGAEAVRRQTLENKYAAMEREDANPAEITAARALDEAELQAEITARVAARVTLYGDEAERLDQELGKLRAIVAGHEATVDQARVLRDLQRDRLRLWVQEQLAVGTARAGVRAFFAEMEAGSKRAGNVVYDNLTSAVDRVSDELSRLFTGQKTNFGQMLQEMGQQLVRDSVKMGLEKGLGAAGKALGIKMPEGKPDGTRAKPYHVIVDNEKGSEDGSDALGGALGDAGGGIAGELVKKGVGGLLGLLKGLFGGGSGVATSSISYMAEGGPVSPSAAYIVGEAGPELLTRTSGHITSNAELRRSLADGGGDTYMSVDARGAELGVEQRVYRAIAAAHKASVATSVRAGHERALRTPQRAGA
jgi:hypothetical protein